MNAVEASRPVVTELTAAGEVIGDAGIHVRAMEEKPKNNGVILQQVRSHEEAMHWLFPMVSVAAMSNFRVNIARDGGINGVEKVSPREKAPSRKNSTVRDGMQGSNCTTGFTQLSSHASTMGPAQTR